jgi:hypothetical protein
MKTYRLSPRIVITYAHYLLTPSIDIWRPRHIKSACGCKIFTAGPFMLEIVSTECLLNKGE